VQSWNKCVKQLSSVVNVRKLTLNHCRHLFNIHMLAIRYLLTGTHKFDRGLSRLLHSELHWLDIPERVTHKLGVIIFGCQHCRAPQYLIDYCLPVSDVASRQHLRSASRRLLVVPRHRLSTYGRRAFAVTGPTAWNSFPDNFRDPDLTTDNFKRLLKTVFVLIVPVQLAH